MPGCRRAIAWFLYQHVFVDASYVENFYFPDGDLAMLAGLMRRD